MPIIFISLNEFFTKKIKKHGYEAYTMKIQDYETNKSRKTYFVSPANSLCFMDGGIDLALSTIIFPNIQQKVKQTVKGLNITNLLGRYYLPIGSSIIIDNINDNKSLVIAPTMLLLQNVSETNNAYYCTLAVLYNILINKKNNIDDIDIIFTSFCCGYGKMNEEMSITQMIKGINFYKYYEPNIIDENVICLEPNLNEQPKLYQNTEWFFINCKDIINV
jgi:O-acetyl-ADP-ribose deacetylase (regulator of RNase III)